MATTNGTHFLLNQRTGWRAADLDSAVIDANTGQLRLQTRPEIERPLVDAQGDFGGLVLPVSLAQDREGHLYILDAQTLRIKRYDPCTQIFDVLPWLGGMGSEPRQFLDPHRIAISGRNDLYVVDTGNRRIQVFALKGLPLRAVWGPLQVLSGADGFSVRPIVLQAPERYEKSNEKEDENYGEEDEDYGEDEVTLDYPPGTWWPWSIALTTQNRAYVSDYANGLIHVFDAIGQWRSAFDGADPAQKQSALKKPTHITVDKQGLLYIIQEGQTYVTVLDADGKFQKRVEYSDDILVDFSPLSVAVDEEGTIYLCDGTTRRLYYYCRGIDGTYASPATCSSFYCVGTALIFDAQGNPLLADAEQQKILQLKTTLIYTNVGTYYSEALDSELYRCQWHRILLSATIPSGTSVTVDTFSAEVLKSREEIVQITKDAATRWVTGQTNGTVGSNDWDCLVRSEPGRYLWLRLTLRSDGVETPTLSKAQIYFPRATSLQYLPATYSEDPDSRDFMERFLSIFDTLRDKIARQVTDIASYFDPGAVPIGQTSQQDFLQWLASWLGLTLDRHWPEEKRRELLRNAYRLYELRGTPEGLRMHIRLYMDIDPLIIEHFKLRRWLFLDTARLGSTGALWGDAVMDRLQLDKHAQIGSFQLIDSGDPQHDPFYRDAHQFTVVVPLRKASDATQQQTLQRIINMAKPAHTQHNLRLIEPRFRIGTQAMLGIDTVIGRYPAQVVTGQGQLGYGTVLGPSTEDEAPTMRLGTRSRIGSTSLID